MSCVNEAAEREAALEDYEAKEATLTTAWEAWGVAMAAAVATCGVAIAEVFGNPLADLACVAAVASATMAKEAVEKAQADFNQAQNRLDEAESAYWGCWEACPSWAEPGLS